MAGALYKKEVLIRPKSSVSISAAVTWVNGWLDGFYTSEDNDGDYFFADIFDPRGKHIMIMRVYHSACKEKYQMAEDELQYTLIGDPDDPGLNDSFLDDVDVPTDGGSDFILSEDKTYIEMSTQVTEKLSTTDSEIIEILNRLNTLENMHEPTMEEDLMVNSTYEEKDITQDPMLEMDVSDPNNP